MFEVISEIGPTVTGLVVLLLVFGGLRYIDEVVEVVASIQRSECGERLEELE
jgi:hypothetical protein